MIVLDSIRLSSIIYRDMYKTIRGRTTWKCTNCGTIYVNQSYKKMYHSCHRCNKFNFIRHNL